MFRQIFLVSLFYILLFQSSLALSNTIIDKARASLGVLGEVRVLITDDARDGCWTNMAYIRELAEENLAKAGARVVTEHNNKIPWAMDGRTAYAIRVVAQRADNGQCFGAIEIFTTALDYGKGNDALYGKMIYDAYETFAFDPDNLNHFVIVNVKRSIDQWAAQ